MAGDSCSSFSCLEMEVAQRFSVGSGSQLRVCWRGLGSLQEDGIGSAPKWRFDPISLELIEFKSLTGLTLLECSRLTFLLVGNGGSLQR